MNKLKEAKTFLGQLKLAWMRDNLEKLVEEANRQDISYCDFLYSLTHGEIDAREQRASERRMTQAQFPFIKTVDDFEFAYQAGITKRQISQLLDMQWLDKAYNIIFLGPPGLGNYRKYLVMERFSTNSRQSYGQCPKSFHNIDVI
jgi:DNA replication protein DnaC